MKKILLTLAASFALTGCQKEMRTIVADQVIDVAAALKKPLDQRLKQLTDSIWYVALSAPTGHMQGHITKAIAHRQKIYCLDELQSRSLNVYDSLGRFLYQLAPSGKGPQEALNITDFSLSEDEVFVTDVLQKRVQVYETDSGRYIRTIHLPFSAYECHKVSYNRLLFVLSPYNEDAGAKYVQNEALITDTLLNPIRFQVDRPVTDMGDVTRSQWNAHCGKTGLFSIFSESIYQYDNAKDSLVCTIGFDYGNDNVTANDAQNYRAYMKYYEQDRMKLTSESPLAIGSYLFGLISDGKAKYLMFYDGHDTYTQPLSPQEYDVTDPLFPVGMVQDEPATLISYVEPTIGIQQLIDRKIPLVGDAQLSEDNYPVVLLFTKLK